MESEQRREESISLLLGDHETLFGCLRELKLIGRYMWFDSLETHIVVVPRNNLSELRKEQVNLLGKRTSVEDSEGRETGVQKWNINSNVEQP
jgi:hypothetical protein